MANKSIAEVEASKEIYAIARQEADLEITKLKEEIQVGRDDGFAIGAIKTNKAHRDYCDFLDALVLYRADKDKTYKKTGLTWDKFCEASGYERSTADRIIKDIEPIFEAFSGNLPVFSGVGINDIRYLGKTKPGTMRGFDKDGNLVIDDEKIPGTGEDITAYIIHLRETHEKEKDDLKASISAKDKVLASKEKVMNDQEREIARLKKSVPKSELTEEEQDAVNLLMRVQTDFMTSLSDIKKKIEPGKAPEIALRQYYYLLIFMQKITMEERIWLQTNYEQAEMGPDEITEEELPPTDVMIDNLPLSAGHGLGAKVVAKIEERKSKKSGK